MNRFLLFVLVATMIRGPVWAEDISNNELRRADKHINCNAPNIFKEYGYTQELGWHGIELFNQALARADTPELKARLEKASLVPYRMSLGVTWLGQTPEVMTEEDKLKYRNSARKQLHCARNTTSPWCMKPE